MKNRYRAILLVFPLLLAACGGAESSDVEARGSAPPTVDARAPMVSADNGSTGQGSIVEFGGPAMFGTLRSVLLDKTLDPTGDLASARFEGTIILIGTPGSDIPGEISLAFDGAYDLAADASQVSMDLSGLDQVAAGVGSEDPAEMALFAQFFQEPVQIITIGDRSWMKWGLLSMFIGSEGKWLEAGVEETGRMTSGFGFGGTGSPAAVLDLLADADAEVERLGAEEVRGASTTHYRAVVEPRTLMKTMTPDELARFEAELGATPLAGFPIDLWIDGNGRLFRYVVDLSDPGVLGDGGSGIVGAEFSFEMWDHGIDLGIEAPPADQIVTEDDLAFDYDFAGLGA